MKLLWAILAFQFTLLAVACSRGHRHVVQINPELQPYYARFLETADTEGHRLYVNDLIMRFADLKAGTLAGHCLVGPDSTPTIEINSNPLSDLNWSQASDMTKEEVVFHELGHCVLKIVNHDQSMWELHPGYEIYNSVMHSDVPDQDYYMEYRNHYIYQLFSLVDWSKFKLTDNGYAGG